MKKKKIMIMFPVILVIISVAWVLTFVLTFLKIWFNQDFLGTWIKSFVPTAFVIAPIWIISTFILDKLVNYLFKKQNKLLKKIILAILMWCVIEFFVSLITMISTQNFENFFINWMILYFKSLPMWFVMWVFMSFVFKPWMNKRVSRVKNLELELNLIK